MKNKSTVSNLLASPVNVNSLIEALDFAEENIVKANREQPSLFLEASRYRVKKMRARIQKESAYEMQQSQASLILRKLKVKGNSITEGYIRDKVRVRPSVIEAKNEYDDSLSNEEWAKLLLEAYRQRASAIKTLAEILGAEANAQARLARRDAEMIGFDKLKEKVRKRYKGESDE